MTWPRPSRLWLRRANDLDLTILSIGLAGLTRSETSLTCAPRCCWLRLNSTSTTPSGALAQTSPGGILNIGGTGHLITTRQADRNPGGDELADIYTFKQSIAATRLMRTPSWRCTQTSRRVSTALLASAARASLRSSGRVATVRYSASRFWSGQRCASLTATGQRLAIWGDWSGFTIVDRLGAQIELIPRLFGATNRFPTGGGAGSCTSGDLRWVSPS